MTHSHEMEQDIATWVAACGYNEVLSALITTCHYWATSGHVPPIEGPSDLWVKRELALRHAQGEGNQ